MGKLKVIMLPVCIVVIVIMLLMGFYFLGDKYALDHLSVRQITPTQAANAMKNDHFWASYRENILVIHGSVNSITQSSDAALVRFKTNSTYSAVCSFTNPSVKISKGQNIQILTIAYAAQREPSGVKFHTCLLQ
jgi:hypothetical protein